MKYTFLILMVLIINKNSFTQINYVKNPSFEDTLSCPNGYGQIYKALWWNKLITGGGGTPDYYNSCCIIGCGVPNNLNNLGFQFPMFGNAYVGISVEHSNGILREYIQNKLNEKLKIGESYCVKFYVNLSNYSAAYIIPLGAYLDNGFVYTPIYLDLAYTDSTYLQPINPQIINSTQILGDTLNWMKIEGSFIANGTEEYITIGNFFPDSLSGIGFLGIDTPAYWTSYYYIDDVSVINVNLPAYAGNDTLIQPGDSVFIGRQPEIGLDEDCIWFVNGQPIDTVAGMWVKPDTTTTYVLQQTICGNVSWDTVTVSVDTGVGVATFELDKRFKVYPNPATNVLTIVCPVTNAVLSISNMLGQEVLRKEVTEKQFDVDVRGFNKGIYFVHLRSENGMVVRRFLKE